MRSVAAAGDNVDRDARRTTRGGDHDNDNDGVIIVGCGDDRGHLVRRPTAATARGGGGGEEEAQ